MPVRVVGRLIPWLYACLVLQERSVSMMQLKTAENVQTTAALSMLTYIFAMIVMTFQEVTPPPRYSHHRLASSWSNTHFA